jgi:iron complex outermembrane receptor protein
VKVGYGLQGSQEIDPYSSIAVLAPSTALTVFGEQIIIPIVPNQNPNPQLKWEQTAQWNVGLDWGILDGRLRGTIDYYQKKTTNVLLRVDVPQPALVTQSYKNVGSLQNRGLELTLDAELFSTSSMTASLGLVGSTNRNRVLDLGGTTFLNSGMATGQGQQGQSSQRLMPGYPVGTFYGPVFAGWDANGKQLFKDFEVQQDANGNISSRREIGTTTTPAAEDYTVLGQAFPDFEASAHGELSAGPFDLSFLVRGQFGNQMFNNTALVYSTKGNALTDPTGIKEPSVFSSRWIEDASFIRGQNVTFAYNLPSTLPQLANARVYASVDNLFLVTDYTGVDPEVTNARAGGSNLEQPGIDNLHYPSPRTFTAGMQIGF